MEMEEELEEEQQFAFVLLCLLQKGSLSPCVCSGATARGGEEYIAKQQRRRPPMPPPPLRGKSLIDASRARRSRNVSYTVLYSMCIAAALCVQRRRRAALHTYTNNMNSCDGMEQTRAAWA